MSRMSTTERDYVLELLLQRVTAPLAYDECIGVTYDDVHEALPGEDVGPDQMDDVLSALDDEEIEVVDDASNIKIAPHRGAEDDAPPKTKAKACKAISFDR